MDIIHTKYLRAISLIEKMEAGGDSPEFESLNDTFIDMANYAAIAAAWCRGEIDGQYYSPFEGTNEVIVDLTSNKQSLFSSRRGG